MFPDYMWFCLAAMDDTKGQYWYSVFYSVIAAPVDVQVADSSFLEGCVFVIKSDCMVRLDLRMSLGIGSYYL